MPAAMEATYQSLTERIRRKWADTQAAGQKRLIIALAGPPGSGKTTIAKRVVEHVRALSAGLPAGAAPSIVAISADGFHLSLATLRAMPNAEEAFRRRGAPWTFDGAAAAAFVRTLRDAGGLKAVTAPTFDHAVKDPVADGLAIDEDVEVCIVEGNYLLSDEAPWSEIAGLADDRWLVHVDPQLAVQRVARRHLQAGIEDTMQKATKRAEENDMVNGTYVMEHSQGRYDLLIESVEEKQSN